MISVYLESYNKRGMPHEMCTTLGAFKFFSALKHIQIVVEILLHSIASQKPGVDVARLDEFMAINRMGGLESQLLYV